MDGLRTTLIESGITHEVIDFLDKEELDEWWVVNNFFKDKCEERFIYSNIARSQVSIIRKVLSTKIQLHVVHCEIQKLSQLVGGDIHGYLRGGIAEEYDYIYDYDAAAAEVAAGMVVANPPFPNMERWEDDTPPSLEPLNAHVDYDGTTRLIITRFEQFNTFELLEAVQTEGGLLEIDVLKLSNLLQAVYKTQKTILN